MHDIRYDLDQPLESLVALADKKFFGVHFVPVTIGGVSLQALQIKDMPRYIDSLVGRTRPGESVDLPLWAKIWPACLVLGLFLSKCPLGDDASILEIGAGGAVNGLMLAAKGYQVTVSDLEDDALLFARINALKNGLEDRLDIKKVDFTTDDMGARFTHIVGCEVLYNESTYVPVADFLDLHLTDAPGAEIVLAMDQKRMARTFFERMAENFQMMKSGVTYRDDEGGEENLVNLFRLRRGAK